MLPKVYQGLVHKNSKWKIKIKNSASYLGYKAGYGALRLVQSCGSAHSCHRTQDWSFTACHWTQDWSSELWIGHKSC